MAGLEIACAHPVGTDDSGCRRMAADLFERRPLTEAELRDAGSAMRALVVAVPGNRPVDPRLINTRAHGRRHMRPGD
jgi:hypothetical protein